MQVHAGPDTTCPGHDTPVTPAGITPRDAFLPPVPASVRSSRPWLWPIVLIIVFLAAAHGSSLGDGFFFDDHLHRLRYAQDEWSWQSLLNASTVKPDEFIDTWWQERTIEWHYTRPFSILLGKLVYHAFDGRPAALHALSLVLHLASSIMVFALARMLTCRTSWALVAGLLFVVYSHSVYAVAWLAAQNSVLQTCLTLGAMLAYVRASRLCLYAGPRTPPIDPRVAGAAPRLRLGWLLLCLALWILALLSRETAVVLPAILAALDLAFGGWRQVRARVPAYLLFASLAGGFLVWRLSLAYHPIPDFYLRRYDGPAYICWYIAKLMHWITSAIWLSPMTLGPTARVNPFREVPGDCLLMLGILTIMTGGYYVACRRIRGWWIWPLWVLLVFLPVAPVMAGPQSGYPAGVGFALAIVLGPALREKSKSRKVEKSKERGRSLFDFSTFRRFDVSKPIAIWFLIATCIYIPIYRKMWRSMNATERATMAGVAALPPPPQATDVFLINLPFVNVYVQLHAKEVLNCPHRPLRAHVLTYAPNLLRVEHPTHIEQLDAYRFTLRINGGRPYFSGALGRFLIESMRPSGPLKTGEIIQGKHFEVCVTQAGADGARELRFRFDRPLADPRHAFYVTTNQSPAMRVKFWGPGEKPADPPTGGGSSNVSLEQVHQAARALAAGSALSAEVLFTAMASDDTTLREAAGTVLRQVAAPLAAALASPVQGELVNTQSAPDWARVRAWWRRHVDDQALQAFRLHRSEFEAYRQTQDSLFRIRAIAGRIIRTDLYMTGPPFPSPGFRSGGRR